MAALRLIYGLLLLATAARAVEIRFVPPSVEGTISLGIYDGDGKLVRALCDEWPIANFAAGLNGLSTEWDGNDSSGRAVASGTYTARGFHMGDVSVDGEAFHFNGWITSEDAPRIVAVGALGILAGGDLLLAARLTSGQGALLRYSPQNETPWVTLATEPLSGPSPEVQLAVAGGRAFVLTDRKFRALDLATGREVAVAEAGPDVLALGGREDRLAVLSGSEIKIYDATNLAERSALPVPPVKAAAVALLGNDGVVVAGEEGSVWHGAPQWQRLETPPASKVRALAAGRGNTFWALEPSADGAVAVVQYSPEEGRLAEWIAASAGEPVSLAAAVDADYFAAVLAGADTERTVAIRRNAANGWELLADKTITASDRFGLVDGELSPAAGSVPAAITVALRENPLDAAAPRSLELRAGKFRSGHDRRTAACPRLGRSGLRPHGRHSRAGAGHGAILPRGRLLRGAIQHRESRRDHRIRRRHDRNGGRRGKVTAPRRRSGSAYPLSSSPVFASVRMNFSRCIDGSGLNESLPP